MKLDDNIKTITEKIKQETGQSSDIIIRDVDLPGKKQVTLVFEEAVSDSTFINRFIMKSLSEDIKHDSHSLFENIFAKLQNDLPIGKLSTIETYEDLYYYMFSGFSIILFQKVKKAIVIENRATLDRGVSEATSEPVIRGPKDSFTENYQINIGLIRKRIKTEKLWIAEQTIGKQTKTKVGVFYMQNIAEEKLVQKIIQELEQIDIDSILDTGYIRELLNQKHGNIPFPKIITTERPDLTCMALLKGKIVIMCENSPYALIIPAFLIDFFHTADDYYQKSVNINFIRIIRALAFFISIITPAYHIALTTFNQEMLPTSLLLNFTAQRDSVPFPAFIEAFLMIIVFEILRESDIRLPTALGSAVSILGALILGEAAVTAGIVSPIMVIVVAVTAISSLVFTSVELISAIRFWRIIFMLFATTLGMYGIVLSFILLLIQLTSIKSFGKPYMIPFAPFYKTSQKDALFRAELPNLTTRPEYLTKKNRIRQKKGD